jgi:hypothetical protein
MNDREIRQTGETDEEMGEETGETRFLGLAPFLRMSIAGLDMLPLARGMLAQTERRPDDANLWLNLSTLMLCLGQRELGLSMQAQALALQRIYLLPAARQPALASAPQSPPLRLLLLMVPGDLSANTPLDCLLEDSDIDLVFYYLSLDAQIELPEHDLLMVAISEADENHELLAALEVGLADWPRPVINAAQYIPNTGRALASELLQQVPGLVIPPTLRVARGDLEALGGAAATPGERFAGCSFPLLLRPVGSHAGRDLAKVGSPDDVASYLAQVASAEFFLSPFIDYRSADGLFRKFRVALIDGEPFACHMGISAHWMIHYVNAGMYEDHAKRAEEAAFMAGFAAFAQRHRVALTAIRERTGLDYVCLDCAETPDGQLLIFEIDHAMVVHAMDPEDQFPYKQLHMAKLRNAFREYLFSRAANCRASVESPL